MKIRLAILALFTITCLMFTGCTEVPFDNVGKQLREGFYVPPNDDEGVY